MNFSVGTSSVKKGESLRDTVETIEAMGVDAIVVRHALGRRALADRRAGSTPSVINAGDGWHEHPTQALLDCYTIRQRRGVARRPAHRHRRRHQAQPGGPLRRARLHRARRRGHAGGAAHAAAAAASTAGRSRSATTSTRCCPRSTSSYLLRMQQERQTEALLPSLREYTAGYGLTARAGRPAARATRWSCTRAR